MTKREERALVARTKAHIKKNKADTEGAVLKAVPGTSRKIIRAVRVDLGIDRPSALAWARNYLKIAPKMPGRVVIKNVLDKFGIHLGPPDVTRLRPRKRKRAK